MTNDLRIAGTDRASADAVLAFYAAFNEGDPTKLDTVLTEDWDEAPRNPGQALGREPMKAFIGKVRTMIPDLMIEPHIVIVSDGEVAVRAEMRGTHLNEMFGVAATGKAFAIRLHEFHSVRDGRLTFTWHMEDWFAFLGQVGAWPPANHSEGDRS